MHLLVVLWVICTSDFCFCVPVDYILDIFLNYLNVLLLLHLPDCMRLANEIFGDLGIQVVTGHWFLSGFIGDSGDRQKLVLQKVLKCSDHLMLLLHHSFRLVLLLFLSLCSLSGFFLENYFSLWHTVCWFREFTVIMFFACIVWCVSVCYWETIVFTSFAVWWPWCV